MKKTSIATAGDSCDEPSSFRDPAGFLFKDKNGRLLRQVNGVYQRDYELLNASGLYAKLTEQGLLVEHEELPLSAAARKGACYVLKPKLIPFISYPYEWCFSQLKDAALLTLDIQLTSLKFGMTLKDASAYNVQFVGSDPIFIDTLSFTRYQEGEPWVAYAQFCRHFLAPLALMAKSDIGLSSLLSSSIDGIDLNLASKLLPRRTYFSPGLFAHIHMQARFNSTFSKTTTNSQLNESLTKRQVSRNALISIIQGLRRCVRSLRFRAKGTEWADYYDATSYDAEGFEEKKAVVGRFIAKAKPKTVWDLGANTGMFSNIAEQAGAYTCAFDIDPACVERCYLNSREGKGGTILPLLLDLRAPSAAIGWGLRERKSLVQRGPCDAVLALALIHHLAIGNNVPLSGIAEFFRELSETAIVEFVPKTDPQSQRLLRSREDVFPHYNEQGFVDAFSRHYVIEDSVSVGRDGRVMYLLTGRDR